MDKTSEHTTAEHVPDDSFVPERSQPNDGVPKETQGEPAAAVGKLRPNFNGLNRQDRRRIASVRRIWMGFPKGPSPEELIDEAKYGVSYKKVRAHMVRIGHRMRRNGLRGASAWSIR